jgi:hypothetical protein
LRVLICFPSFLLDLPSDTLFVRTFVLAFVGQDYACSWESREAWEPHLLRFHPLEAGVRDQGDQILDTAPPGVKARSQARSFLLALEIGNDQAPSC